MLHSQRAGRAENRQNAVCQMDHGGRSQRHYCRVFCDVGHTSVAGNMMVFRREREKSPENYFEEFPETRWHRGEMISVLDKVQRCTVVRDVFL